MYCTAPLSPRKGRLRSSHDDDDDDDDDTIENSVSRIKSDIVSVICFVCVACSNDEFQCKVSVLTPINCIPVTWVCDGDNDCADSSDEHDCSESLQLFAFLLIR